MANTQANDFGFSKARGKIYNSLLETIGGTPLVRPSNLLKKDQIAADILLKLECFNPLASVKDRLAAAMVLQAEADGIISPHKTILVEPTSGNTGIGLAFIAAARGYRLIVTMPEKASIERRKMMRFLDAQLELTPGHLGMAGAIARAEEIVETTPNAWMPKQFENPVNATMHEFTTAEEIWQDTEGKVDIVVAGIGTGGTITGIANGLKKHNCAIEIYGVEPAESAVLNGEEPGPHGIQGIGAGFKPKVLEMDLIKQVLMVSENDALAASRRLASLDGIPVGISSGAALHASLMLATRPENKGKMIVAIAPSFAERYLSTPLFNNLG
ncbi:Cysteine synthase (CysK) (PDB:1FCJ) [Commensalibacter communis]|uniref:cysteine synthase A n=1 Tax=Commensalibacter communis TaxID=2972786 RepID=UPI0022FF6D14|nr:cysteine synthase A [Commensalibacter communis]CAI3928574.1 Cysteine synthase (CysK) (PDB:1FCJ) [Commensalibacter communis]CAI3930714.1 Cysteine synthase (CysK) (PDB:1FCJ) [Commensalibacter communis]